MTFEPLQFPMAMRDSLISAGAGPEPLFDSVTREFLVNQQHDLDSRVARGGMLDFAVMGQRAPW
ncbi:MAG: hypothetical protein AB7V46_20055 [Thermomicrobiales bacterium]